MHFRILNLIIHHQGYLKKNMRCSKNCFKQLFLYKQVGTGPSRRHIQGSKIAKGLPSDNLQYSKIEKKYEPSGAPGPASASPWRAKRETLPKLSTFLWQLKRGGVLRRKNFQKNLTMPKNWKGGPFGILNTQSVVKYQRNWRGTLWREKN